MIRALADRVILAGGFARVAIAFVAGAAGALAMPPVGFWPALALSLTLAVWLLDGSVAGRRHPRLGAIGSAAGIGWVWGFGYLAAGLWWLGAAFLVEADTFAWLMPFGVLGLPAVLAVFPALGFALARALWSRGPARLFALAFGLTLSEWLRGTAFTGFPWNTLGLALGQDLWLMQAASVLGLYGLTVLAVLGLASPATLGTGETPLGRWTLPAASACALALLAVLGAARIPDRPVPTLPDVRLRILQPNLSQDAKFRPDRGDEILSRYLALSDRATAPDRRGLADVTHLVWPESAFPFLLHREPQALSRIAAALAPGTTLVTGAAREGERLPGGPRRFFNAIQVVGPGGEVQATYDKVHLVPFGEYVPAFLDRLLRSLGLRQFVQIPGGFTAGTRRAPLAVDGLPPAAATVCYEAIFPSEIAAEGPRPGLILNVTNDGWFGKTSGPHQHFAQARLRAVEQGLPLVRAANTGISAVVDPYGRVLAALPLGEEGVLDSGLPERLPPTLFHRFGNLFAVLLCTVCFLVAIWPSAPFGAARRGHGWSPAGSRRVDG